GMTISKPSDETATFATNAEPQDAPAPPVSTTNWVVEPKVGIGPIKFGMTVQIAGVNYEDYQDGIILSVGRNSQRVFGMSVVGAGKPGGHTVSAAGISYLDFAGATRDGIRIG